MLRKTCKARDSRSCTYYSDVSVGVMGELLYQ